MEMMYLKRGRRYEPVQPFTGFPADGIWYVHRNGKASTCVVKLDDLDGTDMRVINELGKKYDDLVSFLLKDKKHVPIAELAREIIVVLSKRSDEVDHDGAMW